MDNNICGGPDSGAGISDSSVPLSASAVQQVKAVIMLGDPRFVSGLSYGVGTCTAGGVSHTTVIYMKLLIIFSLMHDLQASAALTPIRSRSTAILRIPSAVMETTPTTTNNTSTSTEKRPWRLSTASYNGVLCMMRACLWLHMMVNCFSDILAKDFFYNKS